MNYYIKVKGIDRYVKITPNNALAFADGIENAKVWNSQAAVNNILKNWSNKMPYAREDMEITCLTEKPKTQFTTSVSITTEEAFTHVATITEAIQMMTTSLPLIPSLNITLEAKQRECDQATSDILHKIELDNLHPLIAVRLVKQLKEIRQERRRVKDALAILDIIQQADISSIEKAITSLSSRNTRTYVAKVLTNLFPTKEELDNADNSSC